MKVLAIQGGGVRGMLAARLGARLEERAPGWSDGLDLIAGTSTGGILALARAHGLAWDEIVKLYRECAKKVFRQTLVTPKGEFDRQGVVEAALRGSFYSNDGLRKVLEETFGDTKLEELRTDVLVPAVSLEGSRPRAQFFTRQREGHQRVVDVALATSAAPAYFPRHLGCLDGGLLMNDPSVAAVLHAAGGWQKLGMAALMGSVSVFTLGTGRASAPEGLLDQLSSGGLLGPVAQGIKLLGRHAHELNPDLDEEVPLDGGEDLKASLVALKRTAENARLKPTVAWLRQESWV